MKREIRVWCASAAAASAAFAATAAASCPTLRSERLNSRASSRFS